MPPPQARIPCRRVAGNADGSAARRDEQMIMQLHLEKLSGPATAPRIWLRSGQSATVGRTEAADYSVPGDERLSGRHFAVDCRAADGRIRDLHSRNGTYVNGQRVREAILHHGDVVLAGTTEFSVTMEFELSADGRPAILPPTYSVQATPSQFLTFQGVDNQPPLREWLVAVRNTSSLYLIIPPGRSDWESQSANSSLFDWLPRSIAQRSSPQFLPPNSHIDLLAQAERLLAEDAALVVVSSVDSEELLAHLRLAARGQRRATAVPDNELLWNDCRPSHLLPKLASSPTDYCRFLFTKLDALVAAVPGPATWQALGGEAFTKILTGIGQAQQRTTSLNS